MAEETKELINNLRKKNLLWTCRNDSGNPQYSLIYYTNTKGKFQEDFRNDGSGVIHNSVRIFYRPYNNARVLIINNMSKIVGYDNGCDDALAEGIFSFDDKGKLKHQHFIWGNQDMKLNRIIKKKFAMETHEKLPYLLKKLKRERHKNLVWRDIEMKLTPSLDSLIRSLSK